MTSSIAFHTIVGESVRTSRALAQRGDYDAAAAHYDTALGHIDL